jgi:hypothetical protein
VINPTEEDSGPTDEELLDAAGINYNQTLSGGWNSAMTQFGIVTSTDKQLLGWILILFISGALVFLGVRLGAPHSFYAIAIPAVILVGIIVFTILGMFSAWMLALLLICVAIAGSVGIMKISGQNSGD